MPDETSTDTSSPAKANGSRLWSSPPVLRSECVANFDALCEALNRDIEPRGILEAIYVNDVACVTWEILRLRRCKTALINGACRGELFVFIRDNLGPADTPEARGKKANQLAHQWFYNDQARKDILKVLHDRFGMDESAIESRVEAAAIRSLFRDLEVLDKMLMALETRRDKALVFVAHYRASFAQQVRQSTDRIIETQTNNVPLVENASVKTAPD